jgi:uncharacterized protein YpmB
MSFYSSIIREDRNAERQKVDIKLFQTDICTIDKVDIYTLYNIYI